MTSALGFIIVSFRRQWWAAPKLLALENFRVSLAACHSKIVGRVVDEVLCHKRVCLLSDPLANDNISQRPCIRDV